ncbi:4-hydroxy-3-methylbut-2-enyl diphosphate reductase [Kibdelosporangium phytohabitans]|uniref:4-hydroxy-3-methylbut-2-enyl diphosphate reductase n=1 Tax=Kibdelosporangium phytohabitans TaxID=860235 RepID=A0A0N9I4N1_9PSEU|nr:4-hydroxy-3-methylbut-2-enyl diphosphate reductase [Kibdelosporangium phytohabitans]ALG09328.1 4-hydroxy-3-methylbut-2-enyl diphosphate reductase [Kibdelosporangium phytohabitans]MBE1469409.1 4-hydroxy-3-methylbut-2-enyl diphosphate reductase [Kibdelosporangium phytohabitans]
MNSGKKVLLVEPRSFCAGVRRAIAIIDLALERHGAPIYVRKEIVHNHYVVRQFERRGVTFVDSEQEVPEGAVCVFSAHGVSPQVRQNAKARNLDVLDATCPLVSKVHQEALRFAKDGRTLLLVGHDGHEEVEGTFGHAPDRTIIVETVEDAEALDLPADAPLAFLTQTTLSVDETKDIIAVLQRRFTDLRGPATDDICYASQNRQDGIRAVVSRSDLVLVVGSRNSSNSIRMVEVAERLGTSSYLVPDVTEFDESWLAGVGTIAVSAGASAPEILVEQLLDRLAELGYADVELEQVAEENIVFSPPARLTVPVV